MDTSEYLTGVREAVPQVIANPDCLTPSAGTLYPMTATRTSWPTRPLPSRTEGLDYSAVFSHEQLLRLRRGFVPASTEDRWFVFCEDDWLYFHQSRGGACIYGVRLDRVTEGAKVGRSWVNRNPDEHAARLPELDRAVLGGLIGHLLLAA